MPNLLPLPKPVAVAAFAGWNDAGGAATDAVVYLSSALDASRYAVISAQPYCDFQVNRPQIRTGDDGERILTWPDTELLEAEANGSTVLLVGGVEPSVRWMDYTEELMHHLKRWGAASLITVGALLADVPHTRDIPVQPSSLDVSLRELMELERPGYEGPVGIPTILEHTATYRYGLPTVALWAAVPHYVGAPPSPKANLALVKTLSQLLDVELDTSDLAAEAKEWQAEIDEMASDDLDISHYVTRLEETKDALDSPAASGEALAKEFEKYLRRRGDNPK